MKKNILAITLIAISATGFSEDSHNINGAASGNSKFDQIMKKMPSNSGVQLIPYKELTEIGFAPIDGMKLFNEQKQKGFVNKSSDDAKALLSINTKSKNFYYDNNNFHDTHMKSNLNQIKLAFVSNPISFIDSSDIIGFAPEGSFEKGWTGVAEYFNYPSIGVCDYIKHNYKLSHGSARIAQEFATQEINNKITVINVSGKEKEGYAYIVNWFDNEYFHTLKCASPEFSKDITSSTINLAKKIDSDQH